MAVSFVDPRDVPYSTVHWIDLEQFVINKTIKLPTHINAKSLEFSLDGRNAFLQKDLGPIEIVDFASGQIIGAVQHSGSNGGLAVSKNGGLLSIGRAGDLLIYQLNPQSDKP